MPITKEEFEKGIEYSYFEKNIIDFLCKRKNEAFTLNEIIENLYPNYVKIKEDQKPKNIKEILFKSLIFAGLDSLVSQLLHDLVKKNMIEGNSIKFEMYYKCK